LAESVVGEVNILGDYATTCLFEVGELMVVVGIDGFDTAVEFVVVITGFVSIAIFYPGDVSGFVVFGLGSVVVSVGDEGKSM
jgi:hypothetical protein